MHCCLCVRLSHELGTGPKRDSALLLQEQLRWTPAAQSAGEVVMENGRMVKFIMQFAHKVVLYLCLCKVTTSTAAFTADRAAGNSLKK